MSVITKNVAIKYRAYPTAEQEEIFAKTFGCVRFVWNQMLLDSQRFQEEAGVCFIPTPAKYKKLYPFLGEVDSLALCNAQMNLQKAYTKCKTERNIGRPHLKSRKTAKRTYTTNNHRRDGHSTVYIEGNYVRLPKVGKVRIHKHRAQKNGWFIKGATVQCSRSGKYYISVLFEYEVEEPIPVVADPDKVIGLDYSSHDFFVGNAGNRANYPRYYRAAEDRLAIEQRKLSHMVKGSNNYMKQKQKVALLHEKTANQRKNFCHELSAAIAKRYDAVCVEDIDLRGMAGSLHLGKSTNDNGFGMFRNMLQYKLEAQGKHLIIADRHFASTKTCSRCGYVLEHIDLGTRQWDCPCCGVHHDRDQNAGENLRNYGLQTLLDAGLLASAEESNIA